MRKLSYLYTGREPEKLETQREPADSPLGIEPTTSFPGKPAALGADWQRTSCVEHLAALVACSATAVALCRGGHSVLVAQRANAHSLCIRPLLSGRMKLMRFQFGFAVNGGTICKQMTELRESGHVCSWTLTEVHPSLQTTANNTETSTDSSSFSNWREIWHIFFFGLRPILSCARLSHCHRIRLGSNGFWNSIPVMIWSTGHNISHLSPTVAFCNDTDFSLFLDTKVNKTCNGTHMFMRVVWHVQGG